MNSTQTLGSTLRRLLSLMFVFVSWLPLAAQDSRQFPLGSIDGFYSIAGGTSVAYVRSVDAGGPGALAGLQPGDYIHGAFGQTFSPSISNHYGVNQELGFAIDRAEGGNGILPLQIIRPGVGGMTLNINVGTTGAFGPAYPRNSSKYAAFYETAVAELHTSAMNSNGSLGYLTGFTGLCIIGHPNWNSTTGPKPYRLSVNKIRDFAISQINNWGYAPTESALVDGSAIPNPVGGPSNWELGQLVMFLSEYYVKTADATVVAPLQRGNEMCGNTVQWWKQPATGAQHSYAEVAGMSSHGGVTGDYMHLWYCGINMTGVHNLNGMGFARRAGMDMSVRPKDGHYYGFTTLNPGDSIPNSIVDALPSSITLPQYAEDPVRGLTISNTSSPLNRSDPSDPFWYNPSVNQKYLMQLNFICRRSLGGDGCIGYAPEAVDNWDAGGRTPGALLALAMYRDDVGGLDAADLNRLEMLKTYITNNYMKQQIAHVYLIGGQVFQALATPYLNDRQQRFYMDNWRFYYALSRTSTNGVRYVQNVGMADSGAYLSDYHCGLINAALPYGIANGSYSTLPGYNTNRSIANFKSPFLMWPSLAARTCTVTTASQPFQVDVCDGNGNLLAPSSYTATWSNVSGPATATFSPSNAANTTVTLPSVSTTPYRIRLTVSRAGVPDLVEDIDVTRTNPPTPVPASIAAQPVPQVTVPGGSATFDITMTGTGPFIYQWRLNGVSYWTASPNSALSLANVGQGAVGSYDCVITTPTGTLVSNPATLTINESLVRTPGGLRREVWTPSYGSAVSDLTSSPGFPHFPNTTSMVTSAEASSFADNYGQKLSGWIKPPVSGAYKFFIASDDSSQLWLSTDDTYANRVKIAEFTGTTGFRSYSTGAQSTTINLVAGQKYYLEIIHKEAGSGDHVNVAWQMPGEAVPANGSEPIPGIYLEYDQYQPLLTNQWTFNESSGSTCADSVGSASGTLYNNPTRVTGISGNAVNFNGANQYAQATLDVSETAYAVSMWFRTTQSGGGLFSVVESGGGHDRSIYLNGGNISSYVWNGETISSTGQNFADGQWHHVVHTFGGAIGGQKLYVDGEQVASGGKANSDFNWQTAIKIGYAAASPTAYFNGQIDDVRVYNSALGISDAGLIYGAGINATPQMNSSTFAISEGASIGATVGSMTATDASPGQSITYSIIGGNVGNRFAINPATGAITLTSTLDYELFTTQVLTITATDNGAPVQSVTATATINVTNVNEPPYFESNPVVGSPAAPGLAYSSSISGTDPENSGSITYAKISGPSWLSIASNGALTGTPASGNIGINSFIVRATDSTSQFVDVTLEIQVIDTAVDPVWTNAAGGSWPVSGNWLSGGVANGQAATANFSSLNLSSNATVNLDGSRTIGGLKFGDTTPSHDWMLNAGSGGTLTLSASSGSPIINVTNQNATINTVLAGNQGLVKTGAGTLALGAVNTLTGTYAIRQGTLAVTRHNAITATSLTLGDSATGSNITGFKVSPGTTSAVLLTSISTSSFGNGHFVTLDSGGSLGANASALNCTLNLAGNVPLTLVAVNTGGHSTAQDWFGNITGSGIASGSTSLILDGTAQVLRLSFGNSSNPNTFTGDVLVKGNVITQNQTYSGNIAANQNNGFRFNNVTLASLGGLNIVWGGETTGALNGPGNVYLNCQSALNDIGLTIGNTNSDGNHTGQIVGGFGIAKVGTGTQILGGANSYGGATLVNAGKLAVNGSIGGSGVTIASGATLAGSGTVSSPVTLTSGATLAAGGSGIGTLTLTNSTVSLHDSGTVALRISKVGGILSSDRLNLMGSSGLVYKGTLTVTTMPGSDPLAAGNSFTLFTKSTGSFSGSFTTLNLPALPGNLIWDTSRLVLDGIIQVATPPPAQSPVFSLASGSYVGPKTVSISSGTPGASIRYTTDDSDPFSSETAVTGTTPVSVAIPAPASVTVRAYAFMAGMSDSAEATATYNTVASDAVTWTNAAGGSWPVTGNWLNGVVASGSGVTARFDMLDLTADATVWLDGARTLGGIKFADTTPSHNWTLNTGSGGPITLAVSSGSPMLTISNQTATVNTVFAGTQGFVKSGTGTLSLGATSTVTGDIIISQGRLALTSNSALPSNCNMVIGDANSGATAPNLYIHNQLTPSFGSLTVASGVAGAKIHTSGWAPSVNGVTTLNSPLTIQQYDGGGVHTGIQTIGKITGPGAGAGNNTLIFSYGGAQNFYWQADNTSANDFAGNIRVTGAAGAMNAQGASNAANNVVIPDSAMVTIDSGCAFRWNNFSNNAVVETFDGLAGAGDMNRNTSEGLIFSLSLTIDARNSANEGQRNFTGALSSLDSFTFTGTGTQILGGANTYTCPTAINGGTLLVNGSLANTTTTVAAAGTLGGSGTIAGAVTNNGTLAPGNAAVGNLTVNNTLTLANDSTIKWQISNWTGTAGTGWDKLTATAINITATSANPIVIRPADISLTNFTEANASFVIAQTTSGITGFSANKFTVITTGLTLPQGAWAVQQSGNNLVLSYTRYNTAPSFIADPIVAGATEDLAVSGSISATDPDTAETLTYSKVSGPAWLGVAANGALSGTPGNSEVGPNNFVVRVSDSMGAQDTAALQITVGNVNDTPVFSVNPINLAATEDLAFSGQLVAADIDAGDTLTYSKVSGPAWLGVASNGALSGTPANSDIGENSFTVKVADAAGANATATLNISVENVNDAPIWASGTLTKADASEAIPYSSSLAGDASDEDADDTLTYSKVSGPAWLSVASNGALSGTPTSSDLGANTFTVRVTDISGATADAALSINVTSANGVWTNLAGGTWSAGANWSGGAIANGLGKTADFSTLNLTANATVTLDGARTIGNLTFGDTTPSHNWTLSSGSGGSLTLNVATGIPTITVNNQTATLGLAISGTKGLSKVGAGTLTLAGNNTYSGGTTLNGGVLQLDGASGTALGSGDLTIASGANGFANGVYLVTDQSSGVVHFNSLGWNYARTNGRNWTVAGLDNPTGSSNNGVVENGGYNKNVSATGTITINPASGNTYTYAGVMRNADAGGGTGLLNVVKNGAGTQILKGTGIAYSGATTVNAGTLAYTPVDSDWTLPSGTKTVASGATMKVDFSPQTTQYRKTNLGSTVINSGGVLELYGTVDNVNSHYLINAWTATGVGTIKVTGGGSISNWTGSGNSLSGFTGLLDIQNGRFAANINSGSTLGGNLDMNIAATGKLDLRSGHFTIDALDGAAGSLVHKSWTGDTVNFTIGSGNGSGTFAGVMQSTNYNVIKTGTGTQTFSGVNTYTGTTTVSGGTLRVNGSLANGAVTVANGGTLGGTGTVGGATTVQSGGSIAPGSNGIGTLTVNNTLSLSGTAQMEISKSGSTFTADKVSGVSTLTYGGTLTVTKVGPDALVAGNTFQLFGATTYSGSFTTFNLPTLGSGLAWDTSRLTADGTIAVYSTSGSGLPAGWAKADIGSPSIAGTSSESGGVFTLAGSGTGFANGGDQAHFIWQTLSGDGEVKVRLSSMSGGDATNATAGVMIRESTLAGSRFAFCGRKGDGSMQLIRRLSSGGNITTTTNGTNSTPVWVRLVRAGNTITAYKSTDGSSWTTVSTETVSMASQISIGVLTSSGNNTNSTTATFDNVIIVP